MTHLPADLRDANANSRDFIRDAATLRRQAAVARRNTKRKGAYNGSSRMLATARAFEAAAVGWASR